MSSRPAASTSCRIKPRSSYRTRRRLRRPRQPRAAPRHRDRCQGRHERDRYAVNPSRQFILRPVAPSLLMAAIFLIGVVGYTQLPVSALPQVDYPTIQVLTFYPGASPDVMATTVPAPLERQFGQLQGLNKMTSTSSGGVSVVVLQFVLSLQIDVAEEEVQSAINPGQSYLPSDLPTPPVYNTSNRA